jgi:sterol desaturase/sphingolipid hydroxylase (fatty acid hydroxylase superfamily)
MKLFYTALAVFFVVGSLVEYWLTRKERQSYYSLKDFKSSVQLMLAGLAIDLVSKTVAIYFLDRLSAVSLFSLGYRWWVWILCYVVWDFIFYVKHYLEHNVRFMWAIHVNHHSSSYMNLSTSLRSGVLKFSYRYFFWAILIYIGFPLPMFLVLYGLGKLWAFFSHSQLPGRWGVLEKFTITHTHHLLHHSCNEDNLNKNFGETFLFWDKLFGTFKETSSPLKYRVEHQPDFNNFHDVVFHEMNSLAKDLKQAATWKEKRASRIVTRINDFILNIIKSSPVFKRALITGKIPND